MTKLRLSLKNSAKPALLVNLLIFLCLVFGCSSSTEPTYTKENIVDSIQDICRKEHNIEVEARLVGRTLWVYLPLENLFSVSEKPEKFTQKFVIEQNQGQFSEGTLKVGYLIKPIPTKEELNNFGYDKAASDKFYKVLRVLRRIVFSTKHSDENAPRFFVLVMADIKNGIMIQQVFYYLDLKKVSYNFISAEEFSHRSLQDSEKSPQIIGDRQGLSLDYRDITMEEFIIKQIQRRIDLKFQKPEVNQSADVDKEILKIVSNTLKIYEFKDFNAAQLYNQLTEDKTFLKKAEVLAGPSD